MTASWRQGALCAQVDPELFFPEPGFPAEPARRVCRGCEVRQECLDFALENLERHGVWGGLSPTQRLALLRQRAPGFHWPKEPVGPSERGRGGQWGSRTQCSRGHDLTPENIYVNPNDPTQRRCRACKRQHQQQRRESERDLRSA